MGDIRNGLSARDSHIWTLRITVFLLVILLFVMLYVIQSRTSDFNIHIPPDLSKGALIKPNELLKPNSYTFAHYIWTELNTWPVSGKSDFKAKFSANSCYITPVFKKWLDAQYLQKKKTGEIDRTRQLLAYKHYDESRVLQISKNVLVIYLDLHLIETVADVEVKNTGIRFPIRVVRDTRKCNRMGMALDGFYTAPTRFDIEGEDA